MSVAATLAQPVAAQEFRLVAADPPTAELTRGLTQITRVFELPDGRIVILDRLAAEVRLADLRNGGAEVLGRYGSGPGEYEAPHELVSLGGDSVGIYDDVLVRILAVSGSGTVAGFVSPFSMAEGTRLAGLVGDGNGWMYGEQKARSTDDSATIFRWRVGAPEAERVEGVHRPLPEGAVSLGSGMIRPGTFARPSTRNMWAVRHDGTLATAMFNPYRVVFVQRSGRRVEGPLIQYERVSVNDSVKRAVLADRPKAVTGQVVVDTRNGWTRIPVREPVFPIDPSTVTWASEVPAFRGDALVAFAPDGKLWIQRTTFVREGGRYDIIGPDGFLVDRVRLPEGHRVIGFGRDAMYVVRRDADDLEFLQRHPIPKR